jgi:Flp pilus assembly pilin Flp
MKKLNNFVRNLWNDEDGQGMAEYVLLIVVILGVAFIFKNKIKDMVDKKMGDVAGEFSGFSSQ